MIQDCVKWMFENQKFKLKEMKDHFNGEFMSWMLKVAAGDK
jgi:hypothetical protein